MSIKTEERNRVLELLHKVLKPGDTVYTVLRHVTRSGMTRHISVALSDSDGVFDLSWATAKALDWRVNVGNHGGVKVEGCGMDMGFHLVYSLSQTMYPKGFECIGERCPSNDHSNGDRDYAPHHHSDGGYALRQRWL